MVLLVIPHSTCRRVLGMVHRARVMDRLLRIYFILLRLQFRLLIILVNYELAMLRYYVFSSAIKVYYRVRWLYYGSRHRCRNAILICRIAYRQTLMFCYKLRIARLRLPWMLAYLLWPLDPITHYHTLLALPAFAIQVVPLLILAVSALNLAISALNIYAIVVKMR